MVEPAALIDEYCGVWSEPDDHRRARRLAAVWSPTGTYTDPSVHVSGPQALLAHVSAVRAAYPGAHVRRTSEVDVHHGVARFRWQLVRADGAALPEGLDIAFLSPQGSRIDRIVGFFGALAPAGAQP